MKKTIYSIVLFCLIGYPFVLGLDAGSSETLHNFQCNWQYQVKIIPTNNTPQYDYALNNNCAVDTTDKTLWNCNCLNESKLILSTNNNTRNKYEITLQYYVNKYNFINETNGTIPSKEEVENEENKRVETYTVQVGPEVKIKKPFKMPEGSMGIMIIVFGFALCCLFILGIIAWKFILNDPKNKIDDKHDDQAQEIIDNILEETKNEQK